MLRSTIVLCFSLTGFLVFGVDRFVQLGGRAKINFPATTRGHTITPTMLIWKKLRLSGVRLDNRQWCIYNDDDSLLVQICPTDNLVEPIRDALVPFNLITFSSLISKMTLMTSLENMVSLWNYGGNDGEYVRMWRVNWIVRRKNCQIFHGREKEIGVPLQFSEEDWNRNLVL